jgi:NhaP-type Na+/H+ or K+/H+ antiporter
MICLNFLKIMCIVLVVLAVRVKKVWLSLWYYHWMHVIYKKSNATSAKNYRCQKLKGWNQPNV